MTHTSKLTNRNRCTRGPICRRRSSKSGASPFRTQRRTKRCNRDAPNRRLLPTHSRSRFDRASALALRAESSSSPNLRAVDWPTIVLHQVIPTTTLSRTQQHDVNFSTRARHRLCARTPPASVVAPTACAQPLTMEDKCRSMITMERNALRPQPGVLCSKVASHLAQRPSTRHCNSREIFAASSNGRTKPN